MASKTRELRLPSSRVKTIMKSSPEVESVSQDSLAVVTKATELFIQDLAKQALKRGKTNRLDYSDVAEVVQTEENLFFLKEIIPRKITVRQYKELMKKEGISDEISSSSGTSEDDSDVEVIEEEEDESSDSSGESEENEKNGGNDGAEEVEEGSEDSEEESDDVEEEETDQVQR